MWLQRPAAEGGPLGVADAAHPPRAAPTVSPSSRIKTIFIEGASLMQLNVVSYWRLPVASTSFTCCCMRDSRGFSVSPVAQARPSHRTAHSAARMLVLLGQFPVPRCSLLSTHPLEGDHSGWFSKRTDSMCVCVWSISIVTKILFPFWGTPTPISSHNERRNLPESSVNTRSL